MSTEQNKSTVSRLIEEGYNKHNFKLLDEIFAKDSISHDPSQPNLGRGPDGARESMQLYTTAFPDSKIVIEREVAEGDYVVQHLRTSGTHTGPLGPIPATGKKTNVTGVIISKLQGGKVVETWSLWDQLSLMQLLGVVPMPETAAKEPVFAGAS
jgi:predicted ester cyclase